MPLINGIGVSQIGERVRLSAKYTCFDESENRMFSEPPFAFQLLQSNSSGVSLIQQNLILGGITC